jgi:hypothetical protein
VVQVGLGFDINTGATEAAAEALAEAAAEALAEAAGGLGYRL